MSDQALKYFGVTAADLLGSGAQSRAYALGETGVLRVFSDRTPLAEVLALETFYGGLDTHAAPFATPRFFEVREVGGSTCVVEARIPGIELNRFLEIAAPPVRAKALAGYMAAAGQIQLIGFDVPYYGQILGAAPVRAETWPGYLRARAQASLEQAPWARTDLTQPARALERLHHLAQSRADAPRRLAHGDYHPGNVLVDDEGQVTGVIDFSVQALMGDPLLDLTSAAFFFDDKVDRAYAARQAHGVSADLFAQASELYWLYYSFFYLSAKTAKPALYDLCIRSLNAVAEA